VGPRAGLGGRKISIPDHPVRSQSLYRLSYRAHEYRSMDIPKRRWLPLSQSFDLSVLDKIHINESYPSEPSHFVLRIRIALHPLDASGVESFFLATFPITYPQMASYKFGYFGK